MNIRPFEIALIGFFVVAAFAGLFYVSTYKPDDNANEKKYGESLVIWGILDDDIMRKVLRDLSEIEVSLKVVTYTQIDSRKFDETLLNAIADGNPPDLVILPHELLATYRSKLQPISFDTIPVRTFRDTYIEGADIFMRSDGIYGIPFAVDPLVMYWNRDIFASNGLPQPPKTWDSLLSNIPQIVKTDDESEIRQSLISFGGFANVEHAKKILSMLFFQAGSTIVDDPGDGYVVNLTKSQQGTLPPGEAALNFYTQFIRPANKYYSWNASKDLDRKEFLAGTLALYFAPASEYKNIVRDNPNLNFDTMGVPQDAGATVARTYGDFYAFSVPLTSKHKQEAFALSMYLASAVNSKFLAESYDFIPVQRALHNSPVADAHKDVAYKAALIAHGWLDPNPVQSSGFFKTMVEAVTTSNERLFSVVMDLNYQLESSFK